MNRTMLEHNKLVYIPATLPSLKLSSNNNYEKQPYFWNKDKSIWYYPNILLSTYHAEKIIDIRKSMNIDNNVKIFGDSGGFQIVTLGGNISPTNVIKWQNNNCDVKLILDRPPYNFGGSAQFSGSPTIEFFNKSLEITKQNAKKALELNNKNGRLYGVIQGENWEQINKWYDEINLLQNSENKFDGWALSPKPSNDIFKIVLFGILVLEKKINKPIHILQVSSRGGILVSAYIRKLLQQTVTIDSSTYSISSRYGLCINPINITNMITIGRKKNNLINNNWFCDCPICSIMNISYETLNDNLIQYLDIHNLYQIVKYVKYCDCIVNDYDMLIMESKSISQDIFQAIEILNYYLNNGFIRTREKYKFLFEGTYNLIQKSIFGF